jgi:hypothetical protein
MALQVDVWTFRAPVAGTDLAGFDVEAADGKVGKVDEAAYDAGDACIIVDTGLPVVGKKVMLPAWTIESIDEDEETVHVDRTKDEIASSPEYDPSGYADQEYRLALASYYADFYR